MKNTRKGKQLKLTCPDDVCLLEEKEIAFPKICMAAKPSAWLDIFCPHGRCEVTSPSQLS